MLVMVCAYLAPLAVHADIPVDYDGENSQQEIDNQTSDEAKTETQKKNEQSEKGKGASGGVPLKIKEWDLSRYQPTIYDGGMVENGMNGITKAGFSLQKFIVLTTDVSMDILFSLKPIEVFADKLDAISNTMFTSFKAKFGTTLVIFALVYAFYQMTIKGSMREGMRRLGKLFLVLAIGGLFLVNMGQYLKIGSHWSNSLQGIVLGSGSGVITLLGGDGSFADSDKIDLKNPSAGTVAIMRNVYFDLALEKPYLLMNYGTPVKAKIDEKTASGEALSRSDKLLSFKRTEDGESARVAFVQKEVKTLENESMHKSNVYNQFGIMLVGLISSIALSVPFIAMAFFSFLLSFLILAIGFVLVYMYFLSIIPQYGNSIFVGIGKVGSLFVIKAMLSAVVLFVYLTCYIVQTLIPVTNTGTYFVNMLILIILLIVMYVKKDAIVKFITAGKVTTVGRGMFKQAHRNIVKPATRKIKSAGKFATKPVRNRMQQTRQLKEEQRRKSARTKFEAKTKEKEEVKRKKAERKTEKKEVKRNKGKGGHVTEGKTPVPRTSTGTKENGSTENNYKRRKQRVSKATTKAIPRTNRSRATQRTKHADVRLVKGKSRSQLSKPIVVQKPSRNTGGQQPSVSKPIVPRNPNRKINRQKKHVPKPMVARKQNRKISMKNVKRHHTFKRLKRRG